MDVLVVVPDPDERARVVDGLRLAFSCNLLLGDSTSDVHRALEVPIALIVIDGDLRPRGGYAALYELRAAEELAGRRRVPALVLGERSEDAWLAQWARADRKIAKPVDPFALARDARSLVRRAASAA